MTNEEGVSIREYIEQILAGDNRLCDAKMSSLQEQIGIRIDGLEESLRQTFVAMDKAILKAEEAQHQHNVTSNNFREQLDRQSRELLPKTEARLMIEALNERVTALFTGVESQLGHITNEITGLRDFRSETGGRGSSRHETWGYAVGLVALLFSLASIVLLVVREIRLG